MNTRMLAPLLALTMNLALAAACDATPLRDQQGPYEFQVLVGGAPARTFHHDGETFVMGDNGERYTLRILNHSGRRIEAVVSVDGRDVIDGKAGDYRSKRGYLVDAYGQTDIEGWRLSAGQAAAFRFSSVADSYAARTGSGREVGAIGVAVFAERYVPPPPPPRPMYVPPCCFRGQSHARAQDEAQATAGRRADAPASQAAPAMPSPPADDRAVAKDKAMAHGDLARRERSRPGLGTSFGEAVESPVYEVAFVRQNQSRPAALLGARYNDHDGLLAMGVDVDGWRDPLDDAQARRTAEPFPVVERQYAAPPPGWDARY